MKRKVLSGLLAASMVFGLCACGSGDGGTGGGSGSGDSGEASSGGSYDQVTFAYSTFNNIPTEETLDTIEEEINKITMRKLL